MKEIFKAAMPETRTNRPPLLTMMQSPARGRSLSSQRRIARLLRQSPARYVSQTRNGDTEEERVPWIWPRREPITLRGRMRFTMEE